MIVCEPKSMLEAWFRLKTGIAHDVDRCVYLGVKGTFGNIVAVLVFHSREGQDIEVNVPPCRLPRELLRAARRYVVDQLECGRVTFKFRADNDRSRVAAVRLGAREEGCIRRFYPDGCAQLVYGLLKEDFRLG